MAVNKVVYGETTVIDITDSTVTASNLKSGETAYGANGQKVTGTLVVPEALDDLSDVVITSPQTAQEIYYDGTEWINYGAKILLTFDDDFRGQTITLTKGQTTITKTAPLSGNTMNLYVNETGLWTISSEISGDTYETEVNVTTFGTSFDAELNSAPPVPQGSVVTPTDDIQTWLHCANIWDKSYTTLAEVLADRSTFETLIADSNACDYMARSTTWADSKVPLMTDNTHPSGIVSASSYLENQDIWNAYRAFHYNPLNNFSDGRGWLAQNGTSDAWIKYEYPQAITIKKWQISSYYGTGAKTFNLYGSNDDSNYTPLDSQSVTQDSHATIHSYDLNNTESYKYLKIVISGSVDIAKGGSRFQFYGVDIVNNQDAMSLIGKYDYCSNALLSNATWAKAIAESDYISEVLPISVPTMTDNTHPSGVVYASTRYGSDATYMEWKAFNPSQANGWVPNSSENSGHPYIQYDFGMPIEIHAVWLKGLNSSGASTVKFNTIIKASNDNFVSDSHDIGTAVISFNYSEAIMTPIMSNVTYKTYRIYYNTRDNANSWTTGQGIKAQFYGRSTNEVLIPLVPTMTSNTTPSGECSGTTARSSDYDFYKAFDKNDSTQYGGNISTAVNASSSGYLQYHFGSPVRLQKMYIKGLSTIPYTGIKVEVSNDGSTFDTIYDESSLNISDSYIDVDSLTPISYAKVTITQRNNTSAGVYLPRVYELQFYSKTVQTNIVHSCANDTIYYMDNGSPVIVATTNSDGDGILDFSLLDEGVYTFYSSVAKNPNDLTLDFCKRIRVTNTQYGETTEAYLLPDTIDTLYWYGYEDENLEDCTTANGWSQIGSRSWGTPTRNTNDISLPSASTNNIGVGSSKSINSSKTHGLMKTTTLASSVGLIMKVSSDKTFASNVDNSQTVANTIQHITANGNTVLSLVGQGGRQGNAYAMWYDRVSSDIPTFISAPNDMLYILEGATKIYIANTNGEGKSYEPLLSAGTYTIYSSIAKDPNNLSNPYSKTITVDESTQTIAVIPNNVLYWYGYMDDELEIISTANGWTHTNYTFTNPTFNVNSARFSSSSGVECGIGTKSTINATKAYMVATGITIASTQYGFMGLISAKNTGSVGTPTYIDSTSQKLYTFTGDGTSKYLYNATANARVFDLFALWYE